MTTQLQIRRGSTLENDSFIGAEGEITYDIQEKNLHIHDGLTPGGKLVGTNHFAPNIFDHKWADHVLNDVSWIRADNFSWQNGTLYKAAYEHLVNDFENSSAQTETVAGITIPYKKAPDGHKIIEPTAETLDALTRIYNTTGIAWYYILDVENQRFKLPRTTFGFTGIRNGVGNYVAPGLPDPNISTTIKVRTNVDGISHNYGNAGNQIMTGAAAGTFVQMSGLTPSSVTNPVYTSNTVQPPATQMYLYFYVGEFVHTPLVNNVTNTWISNCITQVPQDIKLELNDGTLTLKAGSKVYVPNGFEEDGTTKKFDEVIVANDISTTITNYGSQNNILVFIHQTSIGVEGGSNCYSGSTAPTGSTYMNWYDTTNNLLKRTNNGGSTWTSGLSLPISIITSTSNIITSLDQVFNGFSYIGSVTFVLPGVRGLIPDGRNEDGSYKSKELIIQTVKVSNLGSTGGSNRMFLNANGISARGVNYYISDTKPVINEATCIWYDTLNNFMYTTTDSGTTWDNLESAIYLGILKKTTNSTQITTCIPEAPFKAQGRGDIISLLDMMYPIGAIYLGTQNTCPMSIAIPGSQWTLVSSGRALWTGNGSNGNTTIAAGLPNITTVFDSIHWSSPYNTNAIPLTSNNGVMYNAGDSGGYDHLRKSEGENWRGKKIGFNASRSSSIYGSSNTVQPPAYVVNAWRRTA